MTFPLTIAYNIEDKKVGCVLTQAIYGTGLSGGMVSRYFESKLWELNPTKCKLYTVKTEEEFNDIVNITKQHHDKHRGKKSEDTAKAT